MLSDPICEQGISATAPCVFAGETVIYVGEEEAFDDRRGQVVQRDVPLAVCRKTGGALSPTYS